MSRRLRIVVQEHGKTVKEAKDELNSSLYSKKSSILSRESVHRSLIACKATL